MPCVSLHYAARLNSGVRAHMRKSRIFVLLIALSAASFPCLATRPMIDRITVGGESGEIFPEECCWVELPKSERLTAAKRAESCSAIGGPVGRFELVGERLWLVGLLRCGGEELPLSHVYPEAPDRVAATWISGTYFVNLSPRCFGAMGATKSRKSMTLRISAGVATVEAEKVDESECGSAP